MVNDNLKRGRVLFLSPGFFNYDDEILHNIRGQGFDVNHYADRPSTTTLSRIFIRLQLGSLTDRKVNNYYRTILSEIKTRKFTHLFILNPEAVPIWFIRNFKELNANSQTIMYTWDSFANKPKNSSYLQHVDVAYSFDQIDSKNHEKLNFLPLFYTKDIECLSNQDSTQDGFDAIFVGTLHSDRYNYVKRVELALKKSLVNTQVRSYFYCHSYFLYLLKKTFTNEMNKVKLEDVNFESLNRAELLELLGRGRIWLDLEHPGQQGLTMRTIESVGACRKLITTNVNVKDYNFYNPKNILVVDRCNIKVPEDFIRSQYFLPEGESYSMYSIDNWVKTVFDL